MSPADMPPTPAERAALAEANARACATAGGGARNGIAATVMRGDEVLATGENEVHLQNDPTRHAEIVALSRAARAAGRSDLSGCTLISTLQPCEMCLAAMRFAGIARLIFAARQDSVAPKYFMFPGLKLEDFRRASKAPFAVHGGIDEAAVLHLYADGTE